MKVGAKVRVERSVVTGIRIDPSGTLVVEGVDQDAAGNTLAYHQLSYPEGSEVGADVAAAWTTLREFAQRAVDEA